MKRITPFLMLCLLFLLGAQANAQVFIDEDFSTASGTTPPAGWVTNVVFGPAQWEFGVSAVAGGASAAMTNPVAYIDGDINAPQEATLTSPAFDASTAGGAIILSFDSRFIEGYSGCIDVEVFNGTVWTSVYTPPGCSTAGITATHDESPAIDITAAAGGATNAQVRFHWTGDWSWGWTLDNVLVFTCNYATPAGATFSSETCALNATDNTNGGCNSTPEVYETVSCGQTIAGTAWIDDSGTGNRDTDWYSFTVNAATTLNFSGHAEFAASFFVIDLNAGCGGAAVVAGANYGACIPASFTYNIAPGSYAIFVGPDFGADVGCAADNNYYFTLDLVPVVSFGNATPQVCESENVNLNTLTSPSATGGTWAGTGVTGNMFDATAAGAGTHTLTYTVSLSTADPNGCSGGPFVLNVPVTVNPAAPSPTMGAAPTGCAGDVVTLSATAASGGTLTWHETAGGPVVHTGSTYNVTMGSTTEDYYVQEAAPTPAPDLKITEVEQWGTGTGATSPYPAYFGSGTDGIEITNLGNAPINIGGYIVQVASDGADTDESRTFTFPAGVTLAPGDITLVGFADLADDPANLVFYCNATNVVCAGTCGNNPYTSGEDIGYILRAPSNAIVDVVATNGFTAWAANNQGAITDVTAGDWSGAIPSSSGDAGVIRTNSDTNNASDWIISDPTVQTIGSLNPGLSVASSCPSLFVQVDVTPTFSASPTVTSPVSSCGNTTETLSATAAGAGTLTWYDVNDGTGIALGTGTTFNATLGAASQTFYVREEFTAPTCPSAFVPVVVNVNGVTATSSATPSTLPPIGGTSNLSVVASGGTPPYTYSWTPATGLSSTTVANPTATLTASQVYNVTVTDDAGCTVTRTVPVVVGGGSGGGVIPTPLYSPFNILAVAQDTASILVTWNDGNPNEQGFHIYRAREDGSYTLIASVPPGGAGSYLDTGLDPDVQYHYYIRAYRGAETSTHSDQAEDITYPLPPMTSLVTAACYGGQGLAEAYGPHTSQVYRWYNDDDPTTEPITGGSGNEVNTAQFTTPNLMSDQTYYVTAVGRRYESTPRVAITVPVIPRPTAEILTDAAGNMATIVESCGSSYDLNAMLADSSAIYEWFNRFGGKVADGLNYTVTTPGTYYLKVTQNGCSAISQDVNVRLNTAPRARIFQGASVMFCQGGTLGANEIRNASYEWTFGGNVIATTREVDVSQAGTYTLNVTRGNCTTTLTTDVTLREFPTDLTLSTGDTDLCPGEMSFIESPTQAGTSYELFRNDRVFSRSDNNRFDIHSPGEYFVRITYGGTCYAETERVTINYNDIPQASLSRMDNQITLNIENSANFQSIDWFLDGTAAPSFANQQVITVSQEGNYRAEVTYPSGCKTLTGSVYYYERVTGIEDQPETTNGLTLFPNPTQDKLQVRFGQAINESVSFRLTDALGRTLQAGQWEAGTRQAQLSLDELPAGLYTLSLTGEVEGNFRLVKED